MSTQEEKACCFGGNTDGLKRVDEGNCELRADEKRWGPIGVNHTCWACDEEEQDNCCKSHRHGALSREIALLQNISSIALMASKIGKLSFISLLLLSILGIFPALVHGESINHGVHATSLLTAIAVTFSLISVIGTVMAGNTLLIPAPSKEESPSTMMPSKDEQNIFAKKMATALSIPTVSQDRDAHIKTDYTQFLKLHDLIRESFPLVHSKLKRTVVNNYSLFYEWIPEGNAAKRSAVMFCAHLDVVPVQEEDKKKWKFEPFSGHIDESGTVWGRGAIDDKHNVFCQLEAVERLLKINFQPLRPILFAFGHDEEVGGSGGAQQLEKIVREKYGRVAFILDEGPFLVKGLLPGLGNMPIALIGTVEKGNVTAQLSVDVVPPGHSSMPPLESNVGILSQAILRLEKNPFPSHIDDYFKGLQQLSPDLPWHIKFIASNKWFFAPILKRLLLKKGMTAAILRTSTAVTITRSGAKINSIPGLAQAWVNHRIHPADKNHIQVLEYDRKVINDSRVKVEMYTRSMDGPGYILPSPESPTDSDSYRLIQRTIRKVYDNAPSLPGLMIGNTDTKWYWELTNEIYRHSPVLLESIEDLKMFHGDNEKVTTNQLAHIVCFYQEIISSLKEIK